MFDIRKVKRSDVLFIVKTVESTRSFKVAHLKSHFASANLARASTRSLCLHIDV